MSKINKISIIVPCFNEIKTIEKVISSLEEIDLKVPKELIIVDDYSSDGTTDLLNKLQLVRSDIKFLFNEKNYGKGYSIKKGVLQSSGDLIFIQDADLEYNPKDFLKLIYVFENYDADVVYGSRFKHSDVSRVLYFWHSIGNYILTLLSNIFTDLNLTDMETGMKAFKAKKIKSLNLEERRFGFEPEVTAKLNNLKCKFYEVGISYNGRSYDEGKNYMERWYICIKMYFKI